MHGSDPTNNPASATSYSYPISVYGVPVTIQVEPFSMGVEAPVASCETTTGLPGVIDFECSVDGGALVLTWGVPDLLVAWEAIGDKDRKN